MPTTEPDPKLLHVAEAVADGRPVDWQGVAARKPELVRELKGLHWIERIADAYRALQVRKQGSGETTVTEQAPPPAR